MASSATASTIRGSGSSKLVGSGPQDYKFATSAAVDPQGKPHATFPEQTDGDLTLGSRGPGGWSIELIETEGQVGLSCTLSLVETAGST